MSPLQFEQILGQDQVLARLREAQARRRLPHAYLFVGPEGVGRETVARAFFWRLLCVQEKACGECPSCRKFLKGLHPDVEVLEPQGKSIKIEQIRALEAKLHFRPLEAERRLVLIPQAELLTREAANALLKSLEEPPPYTLFVLLAQTTEALLPTIVSRCQVVRFRPLPREVVKRLLEERFACLPPEAEGLSFLAEGSIGRALRLAEKGFLQEMERVAATLKEGTPTRLVTLAEVLAGMKENLPVFLELLLVWWRQALYAYLGLETYPVSLPEPPPQDFLVPAMEKVERLFGALERHLNAEILFLATFSELSRLWREALGQATEIATESARTA